MGDATGGMARSRLPAKSRSSERTPSAERERPERLVRLAELDREAQHLDRLAALGELVGEIVHELRNPLVPIKTFLQLLPERLDDPDFRGEFLALVQDEFGRLERMLDMLSRHAAPRPARSEDSAGSSASPGSSTDDELPRANLQEEIDAVGALLAPRARDRGIVLSVRSAPGLGVVCIQPDELRQVLLNLALNALKITPEGGRVAFSAERERPSGALLLRIDDTGPGVPHALRKTLFEPFVSTRSERPGGLGLAIAQRLVQQAGGTIEVGDAPSGGARFSIRLPQATESADDPTGN